MNANWMLKIHREADNLLPVKDLPCFYAFLSGLDLRLTFFKLAKPGECLPSTEFVRWVNSRLRIPGEFNVFSLLQLRYRAEHIAYESFFLYWKNLYPAPMLLIWQYRRKSLKHQFL